MTQYGLFIGLITLDLIYLAQSPPKNNQKIVASDYTVAAGGPATNAAVTFSYLGNQAKVLGVVGSHPITQLIKGDLATYKVELADLENNNTQAPPVSSIIVTESTGDRSVVSINAIQTQATKESIPPNILDNINIVLIDGHQMAVSWEIAQMAKEKKIPVVIDGGSWKPGYEKIMPFVDYAICSANFYPPSCDTTEEVIDYLSQTGISHIAITQGEKPVQYFTNGKAGFLDVPVVEDEHSKAVDTLAAGDIFHGAFCYYILGLDFIAALEQSAKIASFSCRFFGTRRWMQELDLNSHAKS
jgi:sugar/nucleoside kinase (ribokinase family)